MPALHPVLGTLGMAAGDLVSRSRPDCCDRRHAISVRSGL